MILEIHEHWKKHFMPLLQLQSITAYQVLILLLEKSNMKHKTTKSAHKMSNQMKQMAKRQILCEPIREPSLVTTLCGSTYF